MRLVGKPAFIPLTIATHLLTGETIQASPKFVKTCGIVYRSIGTCKTERRHEIECVTSSTKVTFY